MRVANTPIKMPTANAANMDAQNWLSPPGMLFVFMLIVYWDRLGIGGYLRAGEGLAMRLDYDEIGNKRGPDNKQDQPGDVYKY